MTKKRMIHAPEAMNPELRSIDLRDVYPDVITEDPPSQQRKLQRVTERGKFVTIADEIAKSTFYIRNYKYPNAQQLYSGSLDQDQRIVTKYYPHAKGGPLYVSEPTNLYEQKKAWEKHEVLVKNGFRHIVIENNPPTSLYDALEQLGEL